MSLFLLYGLSCDWYAAAWTCLHNRITYQLYIEIFKFTSVTTYNILSIL